MNSIRFSLLLVMQFCTFPADAQSDSIFLGFNETEPVIKITALKVYVTTVGLVPNRPNQGITFNEETFKEAAIPFYCTSAGLHGYNNFNITDVVYNTQDSKVILVLVTYGVSYVWSEFETSTGFSDELINSTIGNYAAVRSSIGNPLCQLSSFYAFPEEDTYFKFSGESMCGQPDVTCNVTGTQCSETLDGALVVCLSPCKLGYCQNNGTCIQESEDSAPTCSCFSKSDIWYIGKYCEKFVALWMVALTVVGCILLIIFAIALACWYYSAKRKRKEKQMVITDVSAKKAYSNHYKYKNDTVRSQDSDRIQGKENQNFTGVDAEGEVITKSASSHSPKSSSNQRYRRRRRGSSCRSRRTSGRDRSSSESGFREDSFDDSSDVSQDDIQDIDVDGGVPSPRPSSSTSVYPNPASVADLSTRDMETSPIRWIVPSTSPKVTPEPQPQPTVRRGKIDIGARRGWMPSLGPQMFELDRMKEKETPSIGQNLESTSYVSGTDV